MPLIRVTNMNEEQKSCSNGKKKSTYFNHLFISKAVVRKKNKQPTLISPANNLDSFFGN